MHRILITWGMSAAIAASASCSVTMRQVPVTAARIQWQAFAGDWRGTYRMDRYDRHGTVAFRLAAIEEQAFGEVLMIPENTGWPYTMNRPMQEPPEGRMERRPERTQLLTIRFAEAADGRLSGSMDPYWDPDRQCTARASFTGLIDGDSVGGTVTSVCDDGVRVLHGRWRARRVSAGPARE